jgi:hypothetical protein
MLVYQRVATMQSLKTIAMLARLLVGFYLFLFWGVTISLIP